MLFQIVLTSDIIFFVSFYLLLLLKFEPILQFSLFFLVFIICSNELSSSPYFYYIIQESLFYIQVFNIQVQFYKLKSKNIFYNKIDINPKQQLKKKEMGLKQFGFFKIINNCCKQQSDQQTMMDTSSTNNIKTINIQQDYKRFENQTWFRFRKNICFDPKKFIFLYPRYDQEESRLIKHWRNIDMKNAQFGRIGDPDDVRSQRWTYAIRRGVPIIYYKSIISVIFNRNFQILKVKSSYQKLIIEHKVDQCKTKLPPMFGLKQTSLKQAVFAPFFNHEGYQALSNILRLIQKTKGGRLVYNPYLVHIIALFLIFFQQQETFDLVSIMIDSSTNTNDRRMQSLRWHCVFKEQQIEALAESFYVFIGSKSGSVKKLSKHFDTYKIDKIKIFKTIFENFFYGVFPFKFILRIFILFLNEGVKFIFRLFYSLFKGSQLMLKQCQNTDKCLIVIRKRWISCQDVQYQQLLKNAYNVVLQKYVTMKIEESFCQYKQKIVYYIPFIKNESQILTFDDLETIWSYLPQQLQHYDVQKIFPLLQYQQNSTQKKFSDIICLLEGSDLCFIVIKTMNDHVFGAFFARGLIKDRDGYVGHSENFIFELSPNKNKYSSTGENVFYLIHKKDCLQMGGGGDGPAIRLKQNLETGESFRSGTYKNQPLHNGKGSQFKIRKIQLFLLY